MDKQRLQKLAGITEIKLNYNPTYAGGIESYIKRNIKEIFNIISSKVSFQDLSEVGINSVTDIEDVNVRLVSEDLGDDDEYSIYDENNEEHIFDLTKFWICSIRGPKPHHGILITNTPPVLISDIYSGINLILMPYTINDEPVYFNIDY